MVLPTCLLVMQVFLRSPEFQLFFLVGRCQGLGPYHVFLVTGAMGL